MKPGSRGRRAFLSVLLLSLLSLAAAGEEYKDPVYKFKIRPPAGWERTTAGPYLVRFNDKTRQAFIIIDVVIVQGEVSIDEEFKRFIEEKNEEVRRSRSNFRVRQNRPVTINRRPAFLTSAGFQVGPTPVLMNIYYIPIKNKIFMIFTVCPEEKSALWLAAFAQTLESFAELE